MKKTPIAFLVGCSLLVALYGCAPGQESLNSGLAVLGASINSDFQKIRAANELLNRQLSEKYANPDPVDPALVDLEKPSGGAFRIFGKNQFYYKSVKEGTAYYCSPEKPVDAAIIHEIQLMRPLEPLLEQANKSAPDLLTIVFYGMTEPTSIAMLYPWIDVISVFPSGISFTIFEWYNRGITSNSASIWSKEPFVDLATGWVMDVAGPVKEGGKNKGATVLGVNLTRLADKYFSNLKGNYLLLSTNLTVVGMSDSARDLLGLKELGMVNILRKSKENAQAKEEYRLTFPGHPDLVHRIAAKLAGSDSGFSLQADGRTWRFASVPIPEVGFKLVGFIIN